MENQTITLITALTSICQNHRHKKSSHFYVEILPAYAGLVGRLKQTWPSGQHMLFPLILFTCELVPPLTNLPHHAQGNVIQKGKYQKKNCNTTRNKIKTKIKVVWQNVPDFDDKFLLFCLSSDQGG